jgi:hypothetical protein
MADDFERALILTFDFTGGVDPELKVMGGTRAA